MKKITRKQRGAIYLKIAKEIFSDLKEGCRICLNLEGESLIPMCELKDHFYEFYLFNPYENGEYQGNGWWDDGKEEEYKIANSERILALLFSFEMTKTENL